MGRVPGPLRRAWPGAALLGVLLAYYAWQASLPRLSTWWDIALLALVLIPAVFALVWSVLPLRRSVVLLPIGLVALALAFACEKAGLGIAGNFAKLCATTALAFWLLGYFETVAWVALVALIVPWVDAYSVFRGPTHSIVHHHAHVFTTLTFAIPVPGEHSAANLGVPDLLFFALFLAAAARFGLRLGWTWLALCVSLGLTMVIAVATGYGGLPALPGLALGFFLPNLDLIWRGVRRPGVAAP